MVKWPVPETEIKTVAVNGPLKGMQVRARGNQFQVSTDQAPPFDKWTYELWQMPEEQLDVEILPHIRGLIRDKAFKSETDKGGLYFFWMDNLQ